MQSADQMPAKASHKCYIRQWQRLFAWLVLVLVAANGALAQPTGAGTGVAGPGDSSQAPVGGSVPSFQVRIGATCSMSGKFRSTSAFIFQALRLFEETVNKNIPFKTKTGGNITVNITIYDDESSTEKVESLYRQMSGTADFDFFLGPYSSGLSLAAAHSTDAAQRLNMLHSAATPSIYVKEDSQPRFGYLFAVNPMATDYFLDALEVLRAQGAKTLAVARGSQLFHHALCDGVLMHGKRLGYKLLGDFAINGDDFTQSIRTARALAPDVFIGCGHLDNVISIAVTSKALMFNPKAMVLSTAATQAYVNAVEARNANYVLGPVTWAKEVEGPVCKVFGSSQAFNELFLNRWGIEPTYQAAWAAAAAIVLMTAAEIYGLPRPEASAIRSTLLSQDIPTFAGMMKFNVTGQRIGGRGHTQQIVPSPLATTPLERFTQSAMKAATLEDPPRYPAPTWEQRELEIYPCSEGSLRKRSAAAVGECILCPLGKSRNNASLDCRECGDQAYSDQPGLSECRPCQEGMNCAGFSGGTPRSSSGFYSVWEERHSSFKFYTCDPPELCLGANKCVGANEGILCNQCPYGYANRGWSGLGKIRGLCHECPSGSANIGLFVLLAVTYLLYILLLSVSDHASSHSLAALHGVILKISVNYGHFISVMMVATEFPAFKSWPRIRLLWEMMSNPLLSVLNVDCVSHFFNIRPDKYTVIVALALLPLGLGVSWLLFFLYSLVCIRKVRRGIKEFEANKERTHVGVPSIFDVRKGGIEGTQKLKGPSRSGVQAVHPSDPMNMDSQENKAGKTFSNDPGLYWPEDGMVDHSTGIMFSTATDLDMRQIGLDAKAAKAAQKAKEETSPRLSHTGSMTLFGGKVGLDTLGVRKRLGDLLLLMDPKVERDIKDHLSVVWTRIAIISVYVLHPVAMQMLLSSVYCVQLDQLRLHRDLSVICNDGDHRVWFGIGIFSLILYGVGIPFITWSILYKHRDHLLNIDVRRKYGYLYNGFKTSYYNFEVWNMVRKFLILAAASIPETYARTMTMIWLSCIFLAVHMHIEPWDVRGYYIFHKLETLSLSALICSLSLRLGLEVREDIDSVMFEFLWSDVLEAVCIGFVGLIHLKFCMLAVWGCLRSALIKQLLFKKKCLPATLNRFQLFLCRLVEHTHHHMKMIPTVHAIDTSGLTAPEQQLLKSCLRATIKHYMACKAPHLEEGLHLEHVECAIREAFHRCERIIVHKVKVLFNEHKAQQHLFSEDGTDTGSDNITSWIRSVGPNISNEALTRAARHYAEMGGINVEEFQIALMISWPDIAAGHPQFFQNINDEDRQRSLDKAADNDDLVFDNDRSLENMLDVLDRRAQHKQTFAASLEEIVKQENSRVNLENRMAKTLTDTDATFDLLGLHAVKTDGFLPALETGFADDEEKDLMQKDHDAAFDEHIDLQAQVLYLKALCIKVNSRKGSDVQSMPVARLLENEITEAMSGEDAKVDLEVLTMPADDPLLAKLDVSNFSATQGSILPERVAPTTKPLATTNAAPATSIKASALPGGASNGGATKITPLGGALCGALRPLSAMGPCGPLRSLHETTLPLSSGSLLPQSTLKTQAEI